jgi:hypothetical protein
VNIAIVAPVWFAVPPTGYGGIEWVVSLLADALAEAGHDVTLFASGDSQTKAQLAFVYPEAPSRQIGRTYWELRHALACFDRADEFEIINDHTGMLGATLGGLVRTPVAHTVHGPLDGEPGAIYEQIGRVAPRVGLISISMNQRKPRPHLNWIANVHNALDFSVYPVKPHRGDYLLFLGRLSPDKGAHRAIAVAMETGLPLKIAGKMQEPKERDYFHELVEPHLVDGIEYLGGAAAERACDALPDRVGGAVRAGDDRVDGMRDARDRDTPWRRPGGDRARPERHHRRGLPGDGARARAGGRPRPVRAPPLRRAGVLAAAHGAGLHRRIRGGDRAGPRPGYRQASPLDYPRRRSGSSQALTRLRPHDGQRSGKNATLLAHLGQTQAGTDASAGAGSACGTSATLLAHLGQTQAGMDASVGAGRPVGREPSYICVMSRLDRRFWARLGYTRTRSSMYASSRSRSASVSSIGSPAPR